MGCREALLACMPSRSGSHWNFHGFMYTCAARRLINKLTNSQRKLGMHTHTSQRSLHRQHECVFNLRAKDVGQAIRRSDEFATNSKTSAPIPHLWWCRSSAFRAFRCWAGCWRRLCIAVGNVSIRPASYGRALGQFPYTGMEDGVKVSGILLRCPKRRSRINSTLIDREKLVIVLVIIWHFY
jgi:hypothetical protein